MIVWSFFDGCATGFQALKELNIPVHKYYAYEIDKYAIQIAKKNHPKIIHMGDVTKWMEHNLEIPDLIIGGSPCQGFSFAGKQLNFEDPRSKLFFVFADAVKYAKAKNPNVKFMLENVKMKREYQNVISKYMEVEPIEINSALVSAQNRKRLYWTNIPNVELPEDRGILLKDILEGDFVDRDKSHCLDANYYKGGNLKNYFEKSRRQLVFGGAMRGRYNPDGSTSQRLEFNGEEKSNALTTVQKDSLVIIDDLYKSRPERAYKEKSCSLRCNCSQLKVKSDIAYRKLTPIECERLQTLPDGYTEGVSNTQRYKMLGNGWTLEVIKHIFKNLEV